MHPGPRKVGAACGKRLLGGLLTLTTGFACSRAGFEGAPWWDLRWERRMQLVFDNSPHSEDLVGFPALIQLNPDRIDYAATAPGGSDLRFVDSSGSRLPHEIESWQLGGESIVWVRVDTLAALSSTDSIWLYYGNPAAGDDQNAAEVWQADYVAVWHMQDVLSDEQSGGQVRDSTENGNHGVQRGQASAVGILAGGQRFDGVDDDAELPATLVTNLTEFTFSGWVSWEGTTSWQRIFDFADGPCTASSGKYMYLSPTGNVGGLRFHISPAGYNNNQGVVGTSPLTSAWQFVAVTLGNGEAALYADGVSQGAQAVTLTPVDLGAVRNWLGQSNFSGDPHFEGVIDEYRLERVARSPTWIAAQHRSMIDALVSFGSQQQMGSQ